MNYFTFPFRWAFCLLILTPLMLIAVFFGLLGGKHRMVLAFWQRILNRIWSDV